MEGRTLVTYDELNTQNHKITEISNVFVYLIKDRSMCDTAIVCDLFFKYADLVASHLEIQDKHLYAAILGGGSANDKHVAENFMSGSKEIKRIFRGYLKKWSHPRRHELIIADHPGFVRETEEVFELVLKRIQDEVEHLYPLVRSISGDMQQVA